MPLATSFLFTTWNLRGVNVPATVRPSLVFPETASEYPPLFGAAAAAFLSVVADAVPAAIVSMDMASATKMAISPIGPNLFFMA